MKTNLLITILVLSIIISTTQTVYASSNGHTLGIVQWQYGCHPIVFNADHGFC